MDGGRDGWMDTLSFGLIEEGTRPFALRVI